MLLTQSEINTLIAACMLVSVRYETEANAKIKSTFLSKESLLFEAQKYNELEQKLRDNFYSNETENGYSNAPKILNEV